MVEPRAYNFWVLARVFVTGRWQAHVLEIDAVTQGDSLEHAVKMAAEAALRIVAEDVGRGRDPYSRRAPEREWAVLWENLRPPIEIYDDLRTAEREGSGLVACQLLIRAGSATDWRLPIIWGIYDCRPL